jgi:hypothetical protein
LLRLVSAFHHYISSLEPGIKEFARGVRSYWGIENKLHWILDVQLMCSMEFLTQLISKYREYIRDPEGSAPEIMDMFFVRDNIEQILENHDSAKNMSPEPHQQIIELDDELWYKINVFLEIIGSHVLQNARTKLNVPRKRWWWFIDELTSKKVASNW